jgi:hypothetical protein
LEAVERAHQLRLTRHLPITAHQAHSQQSQLVVVAVQVMLLMERLKMVHPVVLAVVEVSSLEMVDLETLEDLLHQKVIMEVRALVAQASMVAAVVVGLVLWEAMVHPQLLELVALEHFQASLALL